MNRKKLIGYFFTSAFAVFITLTATAQQSKHILKTIIVDPGHGYPDGGAEGRYSREADIALAVARKLVKKIQDSLPEVKVLITRNDQYLPNGLHNLDEANRWRAQFANENHGDLFICIHCNDAGSKIIYHSEITGYHTRVYYTGKGKKRKKHSQRVPEYNRWTTPNPVKGTETYVWGVDKNDSKQQFIGNNADSSDFYGEKDSLSQEMTSEQKIAAALKMKKYFNRSIFLAGLIQDQYKLQNRLIHADFGDGVKQRTKGIWVLQATAMPSVLTEIGFITNPDEENYLNSQAGQDQIASAIFNAVSVYKKQVDAGRVR
ncbi:MAG: N-acetylmuramoyl-L-alanine amidase [Arachidicoccus sp.]|nr:N-acetylmuramoyl-L-alanine amidase [Arachidicoccus sp.]